MYAMIFG